MRTAHALVALLVLLAGCSAGLPGGATEDGTVHVYVSDDPGAIDDFEHLNVTITAFSLRAAEPAGEHDDAGHHRHHHEGNWTTYDLNATTVDLTELRGANASLLHAVGVPNGEYAAISVTVANVNGTLVSGEPATVKVPRDRLVVEKSFTVGPNESVEFVVDAVVHERGDGTYVLKPNPNASGTDVDIRHHGCDCGHSHEWRCGSGETVTGTADGGCGGHHGGGHHHDGTDHHHGDGGHHENTTAG